MIQKYKNLISIIISIILVICYTEYRLSLIKDDYSYYKSNIEIKLKELQTQKMLIDSTKMITLHQIKQNQIIIDSLRIELQEQKIDSISIFDALEFLKRFSEH